MEINAQRKNVDFMANRFESHNKGFLDDSDWMLKVKLLANNDRIRKIVFRQKKLETVTCQMIWQAMLQASLR